MKEYCKVCPFCRSDDTGLDYNRVSKRSVSKCLSCGYVSTQLFPDIEKQVVDMWKVKK